jgi:hypothetical protein
LQKSKLPKIERLAAYGWGIAKYCTYVHVMCQCRATIPISVAFRRSSPFVAATASWRPADFGLRFDLTASKIDAAFTLLDEPAVAAAPSDYRSVVLLDSEI